ncbi:MAG TPA: hypothetical protein VEB00_02375 [Clostridia bacterium]|nr:hypothetical protein [Clostridia bacterium]
MDFLLGVMSSIVAAIIIYIFKSQLQNLANLVLFRVYPNISGKWQVIYNNEVSPEDKEFMELTQFGSRVKGACRTYNDEKLISEDKVVGKITPSGIFQFEWESRSQEHHQYGSALLRVSNYKNKMTGFFITICCVCEANPASAELELIRK